MEKVALNRPLASYLVVQSSLVLVVLAASHILYRLLSSTSEPSVGPLQLSLLLVLLTQLPVAVLYARSEVRNLNSAEGWVLGGTFVGFTVLAEGGLQALLGQLWPVLARRHGLTMESAQDALVFGVCLTLLLFIVASFAVSALFRLSVRNNLRGAETSEPAEPVVMKALSMLRLRMLPGTQSAMMCGVAAIAMAWSMETGSIIGFVLAISLLTLGLGIAATPFIHGSSPVRWREVGVMLLPISVTAMMCWTITGVGLHALRDIGAAMGGTPLATRAFPGLVGVDGRVLMEITAQVSGILVGILCANVVVIWMFARLIKPRLLRRHYADQQVAPGSDTFEDIPSFSTTVLTSSEAMDMVRTARELLEDQPPLHAGLRPANQPS